MVSGATGLLELEQFNISSVEDGGDVLFQPVIIYLENKFLGTLFMVELTMLATGLQPCFVALAHTRKNT